VVILKINSNINTNTSIDQNKANNMSSSSDVKYGTKELTEKEIEDHLVELEQDVIRSDEERSASRASAFTYTTSNPTPTRTKRGWFGSVCNRFSSKGPNGQGNYDIRKTPMCWTILNIDIPLYRDKRFQRAVLVGSSLMLAFIGYLGFIYEYIEFDPPVAAWIPGIIGVVGLVSMNLVHFPDPDGQRADFMLDTTYGDGRMTVAEIYFVLAIALTVLPVVISVFVMIVDYSHQKEHTVALALFFQTGCLAIASFALMGARSMRITPAKKDEDSYLPGF